MDTIDKDILRQLQADSRISISDLSGKINLSISATAERVKKLEKSGIIKQYTAVLDSAYLGKELMAHILISLAHPNVTENFLNFVKNDNDILDCHYIAGDYDYILKVATKNTSELENLLNRVKSVDGIIKTNSIIVLGKEKESSSILI